MLACLALFANSPCRAILCRALPCLAMPFYPIRLSVSVARIYTHFSSFSLSDTAWYDKATKWGDIYMYVVLLRVYDGYCCWWWWWLMCLFRSSNRSKRALYPTVLSCSQRWLRYVALYIKGMARSLCMCVRWCAGCWTTFRHVFISSHDRHLSFWNSSIWWNRWSILFLTQIFLAWLFTSRWCPMRGAAWLAGTWCGCGVLYGPPKMNSFTCVCMRWLSCLFIRICLFVNFSQSVSTLESS